MSSRLEEKIAGTDRQVRKLPRRKIYILALSPLVILGIAALLTFLTQSAHAQRATGLEAPDVVGCWNIISSPNSGAGNNLLLDVAAVGLGDIWAVGSYGSAPAQTLVEHWDGSAWSIVSSPNQGTGSNYLTGVAAVGANNVWAVGYYANGSSVHQTLVEHWNGSAWTIVSSPNQGTGSNNLQEVAVVAANDIWAVGDYTGASAARTLTEHWNGSSWSIVSSPNLGSGDNLLTGVAAVAANNVWAVGYYQDTGGTYKTLVEHWQGVAWNTDSSPNQGTGHNLLWGVAVASANDIWAVGSYGSTGAPLAEHFTGSQWNIVSVVPIGTDDTLSAVAVVSANDVWAVGSVSNGSYYTPITYHWDGSTWSLVGAPGLGAGAYLLGVDVVSTNVAWAVGYYSDGSADRTLVEKNSPCPASPTPTNTPLPSQTPGGPTATPNATSCPIQFTDVQPGSTFYTWVRCLACRGIINGYSDGTFKPNNLVTRGQLSKIVSNSAGFNDPQTTQMFQDVPVGSTFFDFIGRLASRGYINGYPCGGPGEPCVPPSNLPYFRTNANATRGQISKIVSNAAGFNEPVSGQTFEDVPPGSTFYDFIERLVSRGVMNGYPCGSVPEEPCVPPGNRPYFRPSNNATRGQTSKIDANTFYPGCVTPH